MNTASPFKVGDLIVFKAYEMPRSYYADPYAPFEPPICKKVVRRVNRVSGGRVFVRFKNKVQSFDWCNVYRV